MRVLQSALAVQRPGRYQVEAAIAALHDDAASQAVMRAMLQMGKIDIDGLRRAYEAA